VAGGGVDIHGSDVVWMLLLLLLMMDAVVAVDVGNTRTMTDLVVVAAVVLVLLRVHCNPSYLLSGDPSCVHPIVLEHVGRIVLMDAAEKLGPLDHPMWW
jgi:hypothetical protein